MSKAPHQILKESESHYVNRLGWLRAAVLGANDGILSVASIVSGMAAGNASRGNILLAGLAGLVAGATSMATGEYVSVSSQSDTEKADLTREERELKNNPSFEFEELAQIYVSRGLDLTLARKVAAQLMVRDALGAHARDELGISTLLPPWPLQAALASAASFTLGAILPLMVAAVSPPEILSWMIIASTLVSLGGLGALSAKTGGASLLKPTIRVVFWGSLSLSLTAQVGLLFRVRP